MAKRRIVGKKNRQKAEFVLDWFGNMPYLFLRNTAKSRFNAMTYELRINPKLIALAAAGAALLGMTLDEALLRPVVTPAKPAGK